MNWGKTIGITIIGGVVVRMGWRYFRVNFRLRDVGKIFAASKEWQMALANVAELMDLVRDEMGDDYHVKIRKSWFSMTWWERVWYLFKFDGSGENSGWRYSLWSNVALLVMAETCCVKATVGSALLQDEVPIDVKELKYVTNFANGAYGFVFCVAMGLIDKPTAVEIILNTTRKEPDDANKRSFYELTDRNPGNLEFVYISKGYEELFCPKHYLMLDHLCHNIVLTIRGTSSISDVMTDLICHVDTKSTGVDDDDPAMVTGSHRGIMQAAKNIADTCGDHIKAASEKYDHYNVIITGHSLGAAVATLFSELILQRKIVSFNKLKCYAFGPPPLYRYLQEEQLEDDDVSNVIINISNRNDVVTRLCFHSAMHLLKKLDHIDRLPWPWWKRWKVKSSLFGLTPHEKETLTELVQFCQQQEHEECRIHHAIPLFHRGRVYEIAQGHLILRHRSDFAEIKLDLTGSCFVDHMPNQYWANILKIG